MHVLILLSITQKAQGTNKQFLKGTNVRLYGHTLWRKSKNLSKTPDHKKGFHFCAIKATLSGFLNKVYINNWRII